MYKNLEFKGTKHPVRISNSVLGEWQEETGKTDMRNMTFRDIRIILWHSLMEGYEFAEKECNLKMKDVKMMVDDQGTVETFLKMVPEFYPPPKEEKEGDEEGKQIVPTKK